MLLALAYVLVLAVVALEVPLIFTLRDRVDAEVKSQARSQADIVAASIDLTPVDRDELGRTTATLADRLRGRVIVVGPDGELLTDSAGDERLGIDYSSRPEIAAALGGDPFQERRSSETLGCVLKDADDMKRFRAEVAKGGLAPFLQVGG